MTPLQTAWRWTTRFVATPFVLMGLFCGAATAVILTENDEWWDWLTSED